MNSDYYKNMNSGITIVHCVSMTYWLKPFHPFLDIGRQHRISIFSCPGLSCQSDHMSCPVVFPLVILIFMNFLVFMASYVPTGSFLVPLTMVVLGFLRVCPIHVHFLLLIWISIGSWFALLQISSLVTMSCHINSHRLLETNMTTRLNFVVF